jgi:hypothetical protein
MAYFHFLWNDELVEHLGEHDVLPTDFQEVVCRPERRGESRSSGRPCCWGETSDGRYLICVYEYLDEMTIVPFTAYEVERPARKA